MKTNNTAELENHLQEIANCLRMDAEGKIKVGYHLWYIKEHKKELGYKCFETLVKTKVGITRQTATTYMELCNEYCIKDAEGNPTDQLQDLKKDMKLGQLIACMNSQIGKPDPEDEKSNTSKKNAKRSVKIDARFLSWQELADFCSDTAITIEDGYHLEIRKVSNK